MTSRDIIKLNYRQFLFVFLAFCIMVIVSYFYASNIVRGQLLINGKENIRAAQASIEAELSKAEIFVIDTCFYIESMINNNYTQDVIQGYLKQLNTLLADQAFYGFSGMQVYGFIREEYLNGKDGIAPPDADIRLSSWYTGAYITDGAIHYTEPYSNPKGQMMISISRTMHDKYGNDCGVISVDIDIRSLARFVDNIHFVEGGYGVLIDSNLVTIIHGEVKEMQGKHLVDTSKDSQRVSDAIQEHGSISGMSYTNYNKIKCVVFFRKLFNGWFIGVVTPTTKYYSQVYQMALVLAILGFVMMLFLGSSLVRLYTEKFRSEEESKSKSNFLARMSHEIRTPMNAIVGMSELILREDIPMTIYEHAIGIKQASANLLSIINDILDFSKIESGKMELVETEYLLSSVINDIVSIIRMRVSEKPIDFIVDIDSHLPNQLIGDEVRIRQIILNILNNAVKYTEKGIISFTVTGELKQDEKYVLLKISIADTGRGIKTENFNKVFGDFVQFDKTHNKGIEGTGLGLAITKSLCDAMHGEITFTSEYGKGTTFTTIIPQQIKNSEQIASVKDPETKQVLIYELNNVYANSIAQILDNLGVPNERVTLQSTFYEILKNQSYPFIFVSYVLFEGARTIVERLKLHSKLVLMVEYGAELGPRDICTLSIPAHVLSVADILNDKIDFHAYTAEQRESIARFIAPSARILIVDDINTNLKVAEGLMLPFKMQVDTCKSGAEAIELVKVQTYDLVFMDHMMPEMDGIEATSIIRGLGGKYYKELPIIALTANAVSGVKEMFLQNGMSDFLSKPIEISRLTSILQKWIPDAKREKHADIKKNPVEQTETQLVINGVDIQKGISLTGGSLDIYISTLDIFLEDGQEKIKQVASCLEANDLLLYTTYVHAVKSSAASIGATSLSDLAKALENAGRNEDIEYIKQHHADFIKEFEAVMEGIIQALAARHTEGGSADNTADTGALKQDLADLKEALDMMDTGRIDDIISRLKKENKGKTVSDGIETISRHVLLSDYDEAIATIDQLLAEMV